MKVMRTLLVVAIFILVFSAGGYLGQATYEPQVIVETKYVEVEKLVTEYVIVEEIKEVETIIEKEVEIIVEVPIELRDFESVEELREWLGKCTFILFGKDVDCDDYALWLQQRGLENGYLLNFEVIMPDEYNYFFENLRMDKPHAINLVIIGNDFYYIEPQTREVIWRGSLD